MKSSILIFLSAVLFVSGLPVQADKTENSKNPQSLQHEVIVTADRIPTERREIAGSVTVITQKDLERTKQSTLVEALREAAGLNILQNGPPGSSASLLIRGADNKHTLVMIDGVDVNDPLSPDRSFDLSLLHVADVDRVEILRGSQSTLYGSDAIGGVVNIITRRRLGKPELRFSGHGGSFNTWTGNLNLGGGTDVFRYSLGTSYYRSDGFSSANTAYEGNTENDGHESFTLAAGFGWTPLSQFTLELNTRLIDSRTDIDNGGGAYADDPNNVQHYDALLLNARGRLLLLKNRWEQLFSVSVVDFERNYDNPVDDLHPFDADRSTYNSRRWKLSWQNNLFLHPSNTLVLGIEHENEEGDSFSETESLLFGNSTSFFPHSEAANTAFFIQDKIRLGGFFFAGLGIRHDHHSRAGAATTYRITPAFLLEKTGTKIKATLGTGFKSPSLYQLFAPATFWGPIGNEDLEPEKSVSWDAGIEQNFLEDRLWLSAVYFSHQFDQLIDYDTIQGYVNISEASSRGLEVIARAVPVSWLSLSASYTRLNARNETTDASLLRRPKNKLTFHAGLRLFDKADLEISLLAVGEREDMEWSGWTAVPVTMPGYVLFNAVASFDLSNRFGLFVRLDNILDREYEVVKGYGTPGFSVFTGLDINL
ncbi:MAG: TonB-dependent receptor [Candidatus Aminicenantes bacterium]|nr:TonB-dependent receptor [Candidatus Aminicenantes bacterium]